MDSVFRQWTALELAIFHQWGGPEAAAAIETTKAEIMSQLLGPEKVYKDDLSFILEDFLDENFSTVCEDGSPDQIGELLVVMWRKCCAGDFSMSDDICAKEKTRSSVAGECKGVDQAGDEMDSDEEAEGMTLKEAMGGSEGMDTILEKGNAMIEEDEEEEVPPLVDADGWETVVVGKAKKNRKGKKA